MYRIACIIPTYNGKSELSRLLDSLEKQAAIFDTFVVDSSSTDGTLALAMRRVEHVTVIPSSEFNHGGTRQFLIERIPNYEFYVFLTQDACLTGVNAIENLIEPFSDPEIGAVCGRQLPHLDATLVAQHARLFNYPQVSSKKTIGDVKTWGIKAAFMSNTFGAYRATALREVGGFPNDLILGEDMYVAAKMLLAGWSLMYTSKAVCRHSHNYTIFEEFSRYFDIGVFHSRENWIIEKFGSVAGEGVKYIKSEIKFVSQTSLLKIPELIVRNASKFLGYKLGRIESLLPRWLKSKIGFGNKYWEMR